MQRQTTEIVSHIWEESRVRLKNFIARKINNPADAEDVLQNVFFKIQRNIHRLENEEKLYPWIYQLTRNAIIDYYRESKNHLTDSDAVLNEIAAEMSGKKDAEEEVLQWLVPMIGELPDIYREALLLSDIEGMTQKELSEKLFISLSGAKSRVQRGREHLKKALLDCCQLEFDRAGQIVDYEQNNKDCRVCSH
jgi:RNA polymerase sigma-70 factor (ECF subfamily)